MNTQKLGQLLKRCLHHFTKRFVPSWCFFIFPFGQIETKSVYHNGGENRIMQTMARHVQNERQNNIFTARSSRKNFQR